MNEIEIEFLEWVHPKLGVMPAKVEGGKPLVLKAKIKLPQRQWVGLTDDEMTHTNHHMVEGAYQYSFKQGAKWAEAKLKQKNGYAEEKNNG